MILAPLIYLMGVALVTKRIVMQGNVVFAFHYKAFIQLYITNKIERFSFESGHAVQVVKLIKED